MAEENKGDFSCGDTMLIVECGQMRFMVFYNLYFMHLSVYLTHGIPDNPSFPILPGKSSCRNA